MCYQRKLQYAGVIANVRLDQGKRHVIYLKLPFHQGFTRSSCSTVVSKLSNMWESCMFTFWIWGGGIYYKLLTLIAFTCKSFLACGLLGNDHMHVIGHILDLPKHPSITNTTHTIKLDWYGLLIEVQRNHVLQFTYSALTGLLRYCVPSLHFLELFLNLRGISTCVKESSLT